MSSIDKLNKLADRFARKIVLGQVEQGPVAQPRQEFPVEHSGATLSGGMSGTAQAGDIETALRAANLWDKASEVSPLLNAAGVSDDASVKISIVVDAKLDVKYHVETQPPAAAIKLAALLKNKYSAAMKQALVAAKLTVADTITLGWLTF